MWKYFCSFYFQCWYLFWQAKTSFVLCKLKMVSDCSAWVFIFDNRLLFFSECFYVRNCLSKNWNHSTHIILIFTCNNQNVVLFFALMESAFFWKTLITKYHYFWYSSIFLPIPILLLFKDLIANIPIFFGIVFWLPIIRGGHIPFFLFIYWT